MNLYSTICALPLLLIALAYILPSAKHHGGGGALVLFLMAIPLGIVSFISGILLLTKKSLREGHPKQFYISFGLGSLIPGFYLVALLRDIHW